MADVSDASDVFDLELHEEDSARDSDDDKIELDDVSDLINIYISLTLCCMRKHLLS